MQSKFSKIRKYTKTDAFYSDTNYRYFVHCTCTWVYYTYVQAYYILKYTKNIEEKTLITFKI